MPRSTLRDDYPVSSLDLLGASSVDPSRSSVKVALDDSGVSTANSIGLGGTGGSGLPDPTLPGGNGTVFPTVTVRERFSTGHDSDGNPEWSWATVLEAPAIYWVDRTETDSRSDVVTEKADVTVLYPISSPQIRESATVRTSDGRRWEISALERFPDRIVLSMVRVGSGA